MLITYKRPEPRGIQEDRIVDNAEIHVCKIL